MTKQLKPLFLILTSVFLITTSSCFKGKGELVSEEIILPSLTGIVLRTSDKLIIKEDAMQSIVILGQQNVIDEITRDVESGIWDIDFNRIVRSYDELTIMVSAPFITSIRLTGSGEIESDGQLDMPKSTLTLDGSGTITVDVDVDERLTLNNSASGDIIVTGSAMNTKLILSGSGNIHSFGVDVDDVDVTVSGSGDAEVAADDNLNVVISGSGNVFYKGSPIITQNITGSGSLIPR